MTLSVHSTTRTRGVVDIAETRSPEAPLLLHEHSHGRRRRQRQISRQQRHRCLCMLLCMTLIGLRCVCSFGAKLRSESKTSSCFSFISRLRMESARLDHSEILPKTHCRKSFVVSAAFRLRQVCIHMAQSESAMLTPRPSDGLLSHSMCELCRFRQYALNACSIIAGEKSCLIRASCLEFFSTVRPASLQALESGGAPRHLPPTSLAQSVADLSCASISGQSCDVNIDAFRQHCCLLVISQAAVCSSPCRQRRPMA